MNRWPPKSTHSFGFKPIYNRLLLSNAWRFMNIVSKTTHGATLAGVFSQELVMVIVITRITGFRCFSCSAVSS